jgi:hypothetical protein
MIWYTAIDYKKYIYALGVQRLERLHDIGEKFVDEQELGYSIHDEVGDMREWLYRAALVDDDEVLAGVRGIPAAMTGDADLNHYSDRRQVATTLRWDGGWYTHVWHPDENHPSNRPGQVMAPQEYPHDCPRRVVITAPGIIDVFDESDEATAS